jgi:hypothetical protein
MVPTTPDAVRSPLTYAPLGTSFSRLTTLQAEFSQVLGVSHVFVRHQGAEHFITGHEADSLNFPSVSSRAGQARHDWYDRGDGVLYGYLKTDDRTQGV